MFGQRWIATVTVVLAVMAGWPVQAGPLKPDVLDSDDLAWFYNRPGVSTEVLARDLHDCQAFGRLMNGSNDPAGGMTYGLVGAVMRDIAVKGPTVAYADDCMMIKGYRRFSIAGGKQKAFAAAMDAMPSQLQAQYAGAETPPEGALSRQWANSYWLARAGEGNGRVVTMPSFLPSSPDIPTYNRWGQPKNIKPLPAGSFPTPGNGEAVVLVRIVNPTGGGAIVQFDRRDDKGAADVMATGKYKGWPGFEVTAPKGSAAPVVQAFVVPTGTYALAMARSGRYDFTSFCLGTVAFTVRSGDVVDLGDVTLTAADPTVAARDFPLAPPPLVQFRIDQPEADTTRAAALGSAVSLKSAEYVNGFPRMCPLFARIYGFSLPGAPLWSAP